ncbi:protein of unknown function [Singulisphaera sp. GP187]|uniref:DUF4190 domain-containing protein n=1 Tax=Singulisphaera sp. GP187 TaxID=1882752 RepID=UPI0009286CDE|nr:DUF4190 domain-containing protein [Singulisphaera sp. GP187]SIN92462.1 protein of unknown function [Singulisphaera sp. GP187]
MALDQDQKPSVSISAPISGIDNEIAAYRAISPAAILSLLCGLVAVLCFTSWFFLAFTVAAIVLGLSAERRIRRDPEIWTGRKMAQAGMALGLVFGLAAVTSTLVQDFLRSRGAGHFASQYADVLKKGSIEDAVFYTVSPLAREGKKPAEIYKEISAQAQPGMPNEQLAALRNLQDRLSSGPGEAIVFERLEGHGLDGMNPYASALYRLQGPGNQKFPEKEQYALIFIKGATIKGRTQWWVENSKFPYEPASYVHKQKSTTEEGQGQGHAH